MSRARNVGKCVVCDGQVQAHAAKWTWDYSARKYGSNLPPMLLAHRGHCTDVLKGRLAGSRKG